MFLEGAGVRAELIFLGNAMDGTGRLVSISAFIYVNIIKKRILINGPLVLIAMKRTD